MCKYGLCHYNLRFSEESMVIFVDWRQWKLKYRCFHAFDYEVLATMCRFDVNDGEMVSFSFLRIAWCCIALILRSNSIKLYTSYVWHTSLWPLCECGMSECELISYHLDIYVNLEWQMLGMLYGMLSIRLKGETKHINLFLLFVRHTNISKWKPNN